MTRRLPLRARNRLAEIILAAVADPGARAELEHLASAPALPAGWLAPEEAQHAARLQERARHARRALAGRVPRAPAAPLDEGLDVAAALFDAGLYFETHEVLEPLWREARGDVREVLQGLIQIAVGYQHWADENLAGARSLLVEGTARLRGRSVAGRDLAPFVEAVGAWIPWLSSLDTSPARGRPALPTFPELIDANTRRTPWISD